MQILEDESTTFEKVLEKAEYACEYLSILSRIPLGSSLAGTRLACHNRSVR